MEKVVGILLSALLLVEGAQAQQTCERFVGVGSWNIQWLGNAKDGKRKPQKAEDIASYLAVAGVDVLALAEISVTSKDGGGRARSQPLDDAFAIANATGSKWQYELFPKREGARAPDEQWTGIAWNASVVTKSGGPWKLGPAIDAARENGIKARFDKPEPETIIFSRWPYATKFSAGQGKTDFVVVPVHMKSNVGGAATADARAYEAALLIEALSKLKPEQQDRDLIVLGDTNMLRTDERAGTSFSGAGLRDCNGKDIPTHLASKPGEKDVPFDRIFLMAGQPETKNSCPAEGDGKKAMDFRVVKPSDWKPGTTGAQFRDKLSDHLLVRTAICVMADDD